MKNAEIREQMNARIIAALESGNVPPWRRPWKIGPNAGSPANVISKKAYRGVNTILLDLASMVLEAQGHHIESKWFATYDQWAKLGGQVKKRPDNVPKGHWGTMIYWMSPITKHKTTATGEDEVDRFWCMKTYWVYNIDQVEGKCLDHLRSTNDDTSGSIVDYQPAEDAIKATGAVIRHGGGRAYYSPTPDSITIPPKGTFEGEHDYYATMFHELTHWTEHKDRLNWDRKEQENNYALGELVAEMGACYLCRELGVPASDVLDNHTSYLATWLKVMKGDPKFIFTASSQASKAADYILSFSRPAEVEEQIEQAA